MEYLFGLGRILVGVYFIINGFNHFQHLQASTGYAQSKGVPMPKEAVILTGAMMLLGGLGVLLGIFMTWSIYLLVIFLVAAAFKMHQYWKVADPMQKMNERINFQKNLALAGALLMLL